MKIISYELYDWLNKKILEAEDCVKEAVQGGLHATAAINDAQVYAYQEVVRQIREKFTDEVPDAECKYIEITEDNYRDCLGSKVEVSDDDFRTIHQNCILIGYNEGGRCPIVCRVVGGVVVFYKRARARSTAMKDYLTAKEFAAAAHVSPQTIYKQMVGRLAPYVKTIKGHKRIASDALKDFYEVEEEKNAQTNVNHPDTTEEE